MISSVFLHAQEIAKTAVKVLPLVLKNGRSMEGHSMK